MSHSNNKLWKWLHVQCYSATAKAVALKQNLSLCWMKLAFKSKCSLLIFGGLHITFKCYLIILTFSKNNLNSILPLKNWKHMHNMWAWGKSSNIRCFGTWPAFPTKACTRIGAAMFRQASYLPFCTVHIYHP